MCPVSSSAVIHRQSKTPGPPQLPHLTMASNSPHGLGLFLYYSHVPVGNHISSLCIEYRLQTREGGQVTRCKSGCVRLQQGALVTADFDEITALTLEIARVYFWLLFCFLFLLKTSHHLFFFFFLRAIFLPR